MNRSSSSVSVAAVAVCALGCSPQTHWDVNFAKGFVAPAHTVSVFGVYKDGQMDSEAWGALRPRLEPLLGGRECEPASNPALARTPLFAAIDDYARTNGPTDDLLAQLAPAAGGDLILVLMEAGRPSPAAKISVVDSSAPGPGPGATPGAAGLAAYAPKKHSDSDTSEVLQLSASVFSVAQGRSVGLIQMTYSGDSVHEAEAEFTARIGSFLPASTCKGWNWSVGVSAARIQGLAEE
jgi:hypothetical protein